MTRRGSDGGETIAVGWCAAFPAHDALAFYARTEQFLAWDLRMEQTARGIASQVGGVRGVFFAAWSEKGRGVRPMSILSRSSAWSCGGDEDHGGYGSTDHRFTRCAPHQRSGAKRPANDGLFWSAVAPHTRVWGAHHGREGLVRGWSSLTSRASMRLLTDHKVLRRLQSGPELEEEQAGGEGHIRLIQPAEGGEHDEAEDERCEQRVVQPLPAAAGTRRWSGRRSVHVHARPFFER